ncbi:hypothetical protein F0235_06465 [Vibrio splendidus]|nr:hypothetical protein [Vibrio splendidus]
MISFIPMLLGAFANASAGILLKKTIGLEVGYKYVFFVSMSLLSYAFAFIFYALALKNSPVYLAYIVMTGITTLVLILHSKYYQEMEINSTTMFGIVFVLIGVFLLLKDS